MRDTLHVHYPSHLPPPASFHVPHLVDGVTQSLHQLVPKRQQQRGWWWWEEVDRNGAVAPAVTKKKYIKNKIQTKQENESRYDCTHTHTKPFRHFRTSLFFFFLSVCMCLCVCVTQEFWLVVGCVTLGAGVCGQGSSLSDHLFTLPRNCYNY